MSLEVIPFVDLALGNSSYLVGLPDRRALVIDPRRDRSPYLAEAERRGWVISATAETHLHADFISGGRELQAVGANIYAPAGSSLAFDHHPLQAGEEVALGGLTLTALPTPGHTPEHLSYLLADGARPLALFSGGSLLVGAVARTDLISPDQTEELTRQMFRSLRTVLAPLPDGLGVYPTHGAGSFCTAGTSGERVTTLGAERAHNPYLGIEDEEEFVKLLLTSLGSYPTYYRHLRERNQRGPRIYGNASPHLEALSVDEVGRLVEEGAIVVDVRPAAAWASGHVPGSLSIPLRDAFTPWLGWLVDIDTRLIFIAGPDQDRADLVRRCLDIGYEGLAGELDGGTDAWAAAGHAVTSTPVGPIDQINHARLVDVRQTSEWEAGHIPDAIHAELGSLQGTGFPGGALAVHCEGGDRAATAASLLERAGRSDLTIMTGGPHQWAEATGRRLDTG